VISDQLKQEVLEWIRHDPDKNTADKLAKWLSESNEEELKRCLADFRIWNGWITGGSRSGTFMYE